MHEYFCGVLIFIFSWVIFKSQKFTHLINNLLCVSCEHQVINDLAIKVCGEVSGYSLFKAAAARIVAILYYGYCLRQVATHGQLLNTFFKIATCSNGVGSQSSNTNMSPSGMDRNP